MTEVKQSPCVIRDATRDDIDTIVAFNAAMAEETEGKTLDREILRNGVRGAFESTSGAHYFLAETDGEIAGQLMTTSEWSDWRNGMFWWIQSVFIAQPFRRQGVFSALYEHVRNKALNTPGVCGIRLYVFHENERAIETYRKLGMVVTDYKLCEEEFDARA